MVYREAHEPGCASEPKANESDMIKVTKTENIIKIVFVGSMFTFLAMNMNLGFASELAWWARWWFLGLLLYFGAVSILTQKHFRKMMGLDFSLLVMAFSYLASALFSPNSAKTLLYLLMYVIELLAIIRCTRNLTMGTWRLVISVLFVAITVGAAMTLVGAVSAGEVENRLSGKTNANSVGVSCMIGLLLGYPQLWLKSRFKWAMRGAMLIPLLLLYLSGSRSSLSGLIVGTVFPFWAMRRIKVMLLVFAMLAVMSVAYFGIYASSERKEMLLDDFNVRVVRGETAEERLSSRQTNWDECLMYWRLRPALGWGFSTTDPSGERPIDGSGYHGLLASVGVIGCVGFGFHLLVLLLTEFKHRKRRFSVLPDTDPQNGRWLFSTGAGLSAGMLVQGVGEPWMIGIGSVMTFAYLLSLGALLSSLSWADFLERQEGSVRRPSPSWRQRSQEGLPGARFGL